MLSALREVFSCCVSNNGLGVTLLVADILDAFAQGLCLSCELTSQCSISHNRAYAVKLSLVWGVFIILCK